MLSEKIINLRKSRGWSQEELAERLNVSRQSVSKWESDISTPELDKIVAMSTLFGVSTDYLLKDATANESEPIRDFVSENEDNGDEKVFEEESISKRDVTAAEAEEYLAAVKRVGPRIALGVLLCILSPMALIFMGGLADGGVMLDEGVAVAIGLVTLFALVGAAIALFVPAGMVLSKFEYLEKSSLILPEKTEKALREEYETGEKRSIRGITCGILICIFGVLQLVVVACLLPNHPVIPIASTGFLFLCAAVGVYVIVRVSYLRGAYQKLLQIEEYALENKKQKGWIEDIYWLAVVAIYLSLSFATSAWGVTWIIWPVAAVLSAPVHRFLAGKKKK